MYIKKRFYDPILYSDSFKARDDTFAPVTEPSKKYKTWRAVLDIKTCFNCADNHGRIFNIHDTIILFMKSFRSCENEKSDY